WAGRGNFATAAADASGRVDAFDTSAEDAGLDDGPANGFEDGLDGEEWPPVVALLHPAVRSRAPTMMSRHLMRASSAYRL
ncbi:MAG: TonB-dependent siderophore receptor, partial [Jatrophihabitantaceae bacterium]